MYSSSEFDEVERTGLFNHDQMVSEFTEKAVINMS